MEKILKRLENLIYEIANDRETIIGICNELSEITHALQLLQTDVISSLTLEDITKIVNAFTDINVPIEAVKEEIELNFL